MKNDKSSGKYDLLLDTGRALFWKYGFKRVSIEEVCKEAGIAKMTYYRFFKNKIELAKAVFDRETASSLDKFRNIIKDGSSSKEKIMKLIAMKQGGAEGISKEFIQDFYTSNESGLKIYIEEKTKAAWAEMLNDFKQAQAAGYFRKDLNPEFLFHFSQIAGEMLNDERFTKLYDSPRELLAEFSNFFAYGISPHE